MNENQTYVERYALPLETLMELAEVAPKAAPVAGIDARELVRVLDLHTDKKKGISGQDGISYWTMTVKQAKTAYEELTGADDVTHSRIGCLLGSLGLSKHRTGTGWLVMWNRAQLDILKKHFIL
ncbi:MAG: hypothetical protein CVU44_20900 [Chloroflexi bacterium HGW-Chloroflexi-6]|nr:MAG: hypothetical protein CVU44_20900 [Chloroflexi bacterium HGW-Chloroflexi-6]